LSAEARLAFKFDWTVQRQDTAEILEQEQRKDILYLGSGNAILKRGAAQTLILNKSDSTFHRIFHRDRRIYTFSTPVRYWELLSPERRALEKKVEAMGLLLEVRESTLLGKGTIGPWSARHFRVVATNNEGSLQQVYDLWLSQDLDIDLALYQDLMAAEWALDFGVEDVMLHISSLGGFPVLVKKRIISRKHIYKSILTLISVDEVAMDPPTYQLPKGYQEMPIDPDGRFLFSTEPLGFGSLPE
jgi:hypothetical protein